ncbi:helix-turn-helix transcriptional regulator [Microvirga sp. RSM25]|uniref:helix-turn-helix transcriptional regulator n=1 Tax=Microvirga sp. RSM25 TaxID=3273802 RepID=UPI003850B998
MTDTRKGAKHSMAGREIPLPRDVINLLLAGFPDRAIDRETVSLATGLPAPTLVEMVHAGTFPPPVRLAPNLHGWRVSDVVEWLRERPFVEHLADSGWAERRRA